MTGRDQRCFQGLTKEEFMVFILLSFLYLILFLSVSQVYCLSLFLVISQM